MDICTQYHGNPSHSYQDMSLKNVSLMDVFLNLNLGGGSKKAASLQYISFSLDDKRKLTRSRFFPITSLLFTGNEKQNLTEASHVVKSEAAGYRTSRFCFEIRTEDKKRGLICCVNLCFGFLILPCMQN